MNESMKVCERCEGTGFYRTKCEETHPYTNIYNATTIYEDGYRAPSIMPELGWRHGRAVQYEFKCRNCDEDQVPYQTMQDIPRVGFFEWVGSLVGRVL